MTGISDILKDFRKQMLNTSKNVSESYLLFCTCAPALYSSILLTLYLISNKKLARSCETRISFRTRQPESNHGKDISLREQNYISFTNPAHLKTWQNELILNILLSRRERGRSRAENLCFLLLRTLSAVAAVEPAEIRPCHTPKTPLLHLCQ